MLETVLTQVLQRLGSDWGEAILSEAQDIPPGRERLAWLWGGVTTTLRETRMKTVRIGAIATVAIAIALTVSILLTYPHAAGGAGGPVYTALLAVLLLGYAVTAWILTAGEGRAEALRVGTFAGLIAAALLTLAFQLPVAPGGLILLVPGAVVPLIAALKVPRIETGLWTGMTSALVNLAVGMALVLAFPSRVPMDDNVLLANDTPADILAANVGEHLVGYIGFLVMGPLLGTVFGMLGAAWAQRWRSTQTGS